MKTFKPKNAIGSAKPHIRMRGVKPVAASAFPAAPMAFPPSGPMSGPPDPSVAMPPAPGGMPSGAAPGMTGS